LVTNKSFKFANVFDLVLIPYRRLVNRMTKSKTFTNLNDLFVTKIT